MDTATSSARYTYRLRIGSGAERLLLSEGNRCRRVWNQCVAEATAAYRSGTKIGPAALDKKGTMWRRAGASIPQKQVIRDPDGADRGRPLQSPAGKAA